MRATCISMAAALLLAVGVCVTALCVVGSATREIDDMRAEVLSLLERGDAREAHAKLTQLAGAWKRREPLLELFTPHIHLRDISTLIIDANANLEVGDYDDFARSMALLGEALEHLISEEQITWSNLL